MFSAALHRKSFRFPSCVTATRPVALSCAAVAVLLLAKPQLLLTPNPESTAIWDRARTPNAAVANQAKLLATFAKLPLRFEANRGQTDAQVKFLSRGKGYSLFLTPTETVVKLQQPEESNKPQIAQISQIFPNTLQSASSAKSAAVLRMKFLGANRAPVITGLDELASKSNYFIGNDPKQWRTNVANYGKVKLSDVYPGVDLVYYGNQGQLEYDWIVAPGADPRTIQMQVGGADRLELDAAGNLVAHLGEEQLRLHKPVVYQEDKGQRQIIAGGYKLKGNEQVSFEVASYDAGKPLIIDPTLSLSYSSYLGGSTGDDRALAIAVDSSGMVYITGWTNSTDFPTTSGVVQPAFAGTTQHDVFVAKINPAASGAASLVYSTYFGGTNQDDGQGIAVDSSGNAYVTGFTGSASFPTANPLQAAIGGSFDAFVAKLNSTGAALVYSTFLGGSLSEQGNGIAVDSSGNAYVTGFTLSTNFPTASPFQAALAGGTDAFVAKISVASPAPIPPGLMSWFRADGNALDTISGVTGTLVGGVTFAAGEVNQAFNLNGTSAFVQAGGPLTVTGPRSIVAWVFPRSTTAALGMPILTGGVPGAGDFFGITGTSTGSCGSLPQYRLYVDHWGVPCFVSSTSLTPDTWSLVALTFDGSTMTFYINGVASGSMPAAMYSYGVATYAIGGNTIGGSTTNPFFNGLLDEVQVYARPLLASEIASIFDAGTAGLATSPDLTVSKVHAGSFTLGQVGATYSITVTNVGAAATSGTVAAIDALPAGLTATAISGTGWSCALSSLTCIRSDVLAGGLSYPAITVTVNVSGTAPSSLTNMAIVSGGGETNTANNTASDVAAVITLLTTGLMGHWSLDEAAGSTVAVDISGSGNTATCSGSSCPVFGVSGEIGTAASFDGSNDVLRVNNTIPNSFTVAAWIKTTVVGPDTAGGQGYGGAGIIYSDVPGGAQDMIPMALVGNRLGFDTGSAGGCTSDDTLLSTVAVNTGAWVHVAVTRDMTTGVKQLYINGVLNGSNTNGGTCPLSGNPNILFGGNTVDGRFFNGQIDDIYFYDRVLSSTEVALLAATPAPSTICAPGNPAPISGSTGAQGVLDPANSDPSRGLVWPAGAVFALVNMSSGQVQFSSSSTSFVPIGSAVTLPGVSAVPAFPDGKVNFTSVHLPAGKSVFFVADLLGLPPPVIILSCQDVVLDSGSALGLGGVFFGSDFPHQLPGSFFGGHALSTLGSVAAGFGPRTGSVPAAGSLYPAIGGGGGQGGSSVATGAVQGGMGGEAVVISAAQRITVNGEIRAQGSDAEDAPTGSSGTQGGAGGSVRLAALLVEGTGTINTSAGHDSDLVVRSPNGPIEIQTFLQDLFSGTTSSTPVRGNAPVQPMPENVPAISIDSIAATGVPFNTGSLLTPDVTLLPAPATLDVDVIVTISTHGIPDDTALDVRAVAVDGSSFATTSFVTAGAAAASLTLHAGTTYQIVVTPTTPISLLRSPSVTVATSTRERRGNIFSAPRHNLARENELRKRRLVEQWMKTFGVTEDSDTTGLDAKR